MHVVDPDTFPLDAQAQYKPPVHTLDNAHKFYSTLGIRNMVFVQPSIYANDNSCLLAALEEVGPQHGRAVVQFDPTTITQTQLRSWHKLGVRGVRVNLVSIGRQIDDAEELSLELQQYAKVIQPHDWVLDLYVPLSLMPMLERVIPDLGVKVCIDHFGSPKLPPASSQSYDPYSLPGFSSLVNVLKTADSTTRLKFSGPYRLSKDPQAYKDLQPVATELLKHAENRLVYATDWPHTRFENIDSVPFINKCFEWCGNDEGLIKKLFQWNAESLWDAGPPL